MTPAPEFRVDPDVDLHVPADRAELTAHPATVLGAIAAGGVLGALARAGIQAAFPHPPTGFPWATFGINLAGCLLIGALMAVLGARPAHPLVRPFLGVGVLGGFTTFSAYAVDAQQAVTALVGTGFCGALTTWSTLSYETLRLTREGARFHAVANALASVVAGLGAASLGYALAHALTG